MRPGGARPPAVAGARPRLGEALPEPLRPEAELLGQLPIGAQERLAVPLS
jgi:hypothetical protein